MLPHCHWSYCRFCSLIVSSPQPPDSTPTLKPAGWCFSVQTYTSSPRRLLSWAPSWNCSLTKLPIKICWTLFSAHHHRLSLTSDLVTTHFVKSLLLSLGPIFPHYFPTTLLFSPISFADASSSAPSLNIGVLERALVDFFSFHSMFPQTISSCLMVSAATGIFPDPGLSPEHHTLFSTSTVVSVVRWCHTETSNHNAQN